MRTTVITFGLVLGCARPAPDDVGTSDDDDGASDTSSAAESEDTYNFVPNEEDSGTDTGTGPVDSHDEDILPVWAYNCVIYCHASGGDGPPAGLSLELDDAYDQLVNVPAAQVDMLRVAPGSLKDSYLWHKLRGSHLDVGGSGDQMPLFAPPLDAETMERIATWITIGAPP